MNKQDFKERYEEVYNLYHELLSTHHETLIEIGELKVKTELMKNMLIQNGINVSDIYSEF
ncbi:hypothetical protein [Cohnella sp.]|uniref:hypothetical protein n=1 Tax=Cohnella sp. TaxID=1883426 RepID=UPI0035653E7D